MIWKNPLLTPWSLSLLRSKHRVNVNLERKKLLVSLLNLDAVLITEQLLKDHSIKVALSLKLVMTQSMDVVETEYHQHKGKISKGARRHLVKEHYLDAVPMVGLKQIVKIMKIVLWNSQRLQLADVRLVNMVAALMAKWKLRALMVKAVMNALVIFVVLLPQRQLSQKKQVERPLKLKLQPRNLLKNLVDYLLMDVAQMVKQKPKVNSLLDVQTLQWIVPKLLTVAVQIIKLRQLGPTKQAARNVFPSNSDAVLMDRHQHTVLMEKDVALKHSLAVVQITSMQLVVPIMKDAVASIPHMGAALTTKPRLVATIKKIVIVKIRSSAAAQTNLRLRKERSLRVVSVTHSSLDAVQMESQLLKVHMDKDVTVRKPNLHAVPMKRRLLKVITSRVVLALRVSTAAVLMAKRVRKERISRAAPKLSPILRKHVLSRKTVAHAVTTQLNISMMSNTEHVPVSGMVAVMVMEIDLIQQMNARAYVRSQPEKLFAICRRSSDLAQDTTRNTTMMRNGRVALSSCSEDVLAMTISSTLWRNVCQPVQQIRYYVSPVLSILP